MDRRIDAQVASTQFGHIMDRATQHHERFVVARGGEPAVVIMSVEDFIRTTSPPPDWLQATWDDAKREGLETMSLDEINAEIDAVRREKRAVDSTAS